MPRGLQSQETSIYGRGTLGRCGYPDRSGLRGLQWVPRHGARLCDRDWLQGPQLRMGCREQRLLEPRGRVDHWIGCGALHPEDGSRQHISAPDCGGTAERANLELADVVEVAACEQHPLPYW